jgi:hypothetical protein
MVPELRLDEVEFWVSTVLNVLPYADAGDAGVETVVLSGAADEYGGGGGVGYLRGVDDRRQISA